MQQIQLLLIAYTVYTLELQRKIYKRLFSQSIFYETERNVLNH